MNEMKTVTIGDKTYEIVDAKMREEILQKQPKGDYATQSDVQEAVEAIEKKIPTAVSQLENDKGYLTEHQDVSHFAKKSTTLSGYGITDGATKEQFNQLSSEIVIKAETDEDGIVSFKNSQGLVLFTLDLSEFGGSANVYSELVLSTESVSVKEGHENTFTVKLASAPSTNQEVYLAISDNTKLSVSPSTLTFKPDNWQTEQTVTLVALQDDDTVGELITVSLTSKKVSAKSLLVSITDDDVDLVEDGLTLYYNLRNGDLTDRVGGVVATNGGTIVDGGVRLDSSSTKFQFDYPVQKENIPNGATIELALTGLADFQGAGNGYGTGYAYKNIFYSTRINAGFSYTANGSIASNGFSFETTEAPNTFIDFTTENHICFVYNADGSANVYFNGELFKAMAVPDGFEHYNASGNITFKIPYMGMGEYNSYPITLSEIRIYERALTADEVKNNYDATVSHQETVNF